MSFDLFRDDPNPPADVSSAIGVMNEGQRRRTRRRVLGGVTASVLAFMVGALALSPDSAETVRTDSPFAQRGEGGWSAYPTTTLANDAAVTTSTMKSPSTTVPAGMKGVTSPSIYPPPSTTTTSSAPKPKGTANLTFSGVVSGPLSDAVASCNKRTDGRLSDLVVNGTLNGTPWVLMVQSYNGEEGVWSVVTGRAGGGTGLEGSGYRRTEDYPDTVDGVTDVDWAHGARLDNVTLTSGDGQTPAGTVQVTGTITCP